MKTIICRRMTGGSAWLAAALVAVTTSAQDPFTAGSAIPPPVPEQELPEVLTRGPVHEAFAEPVDLQGRPPATAPTPPPEPIQESPPEMRPEGDNYVWVPGYWAWDTDRGYIWVSACWRAVPPGTYWVPGYWTPAAGNWQWVSGFWASSATTELQYLPPPPPLENTAPPVSESGGVIWVPPCWYWYEGQYVLRPGYWLTAQDDWVWQPSRYVWTPRGHVFVPGRWDYAFESRGVLYAPVAFPTTSYIVGGRYTYTPNVALNLAVLILDLFAYPQYGHYCFGDYYDDSYLRIGIYPRYEFDRYGWYDPIYCYERHHHRRHDPRWDDRVRDHYRTRYDNRDFRPPRTFREMNERQVRQGTLRGTDALAGHVADLAGSILPRTTIRKTDVATRKIADEQAIRARELQKERAQWERVHGLPEGGRLVADPVFVPETRRVTVGKTKPTAQTGTVVVPVKPRDGGPASVTIPVPQPVKTGKTSDIIIRSEPVIRTEPVFRTQPGGPKKGETIGSTGPVTIKKAEPTVRSGPASVSIPLPAPVNGVKFKPVPKRSDPVMPSVSVPIPKVSKPAPPPVKPPKVESGSRVQQTLPAPVFENKPAKKGDSSGLVPAGFEEVVEAIGQRGGKKKK